MEFLRSNLWEIKKSSTVRIYGILLSLCHILTFIFWLQNDQLPLKLAQSTSRMCWPVMEECQLITSVPFSMLSLFFAAYLLFAIISVLVLFSSRLVGMGWFFVFLATAMKAVLYFQDYRLSTNIHYLHFLMLVVWLFLPSKILSFKVLLAGYFITSGVHKLSPEWLTGRWFMDHLNIPVKLAEWLAALSTIIEFIAPVVLFLKDGRYFISAFLVLLVYLGGLFYVNGFLPPSMLGLMLFVFALQMMEERRVEREFIYQSFIRPEPSKIWSVLIVAIFVIGQALPWIPSLPVPLQKAGVLLSLKKQSKINECRQTTFLIYKNQVEELPSDINKGISEESRCDPYLRFLEAKSHCEEHRDKEGFITISSFFSSRGLKDTNFHRIFEVEDICHPDTRFSRLKGGSHGI